VRRREHFIEALTGNLLECSLMHTSMRELVRQQLDSFNQFIEMFAFRNAFRIVKCPYSVHIMEKYSEIQLESQQYIADQKK